MPAKTGTATGNKTVPRLEAAGAATIGMIFSPLTIVAPLILALTKLSIITIELKWLISTSKIEIRIGRVKFWSQPYDNDLTNDQQETNVLVCYK